MKRYMIGEIAKITGLSAHTLRYYEKHNLIMPSYVDEETNYRYYSVSDVEKIEILKEWDGQLIEVPYTKGISSTDLANQYRMLENTPDNRRSKLKKLLLFSI